MSGLLSGSCGCISFLLSSDLVVLLELIVFQFSLSVPVNHQYSLQADDYPVQTAQTNEVEAKISISMQKRAYMNSANAKAYM
jgi:hypothetical protein